MSCCEKWAKETAHIKAMAGGGFAYPEIAHPSAQIEPREDGTWSINGCCGGGCYVITEVRFCPFCGASVEHKKRLGTIPHKAVFTPKP